MVAASLASLLLAALSAVIHYEALRLINGSLLRVSFVPRRAKVLVAMLCAMVSHGCHIALFGAAYYVLRDKFGLGVFGGHFRDVFSSYLYFSAETYTTLGLGDIFPLGSLRMIAGIEALTGLLMISWTASFTYLEMSRYWKEP